MRRNFLVLALAMAISHVACGADNNTTGHTSPEPPPEVSSKQADSMKTRLASQSSDQVDKLGPSSNALPPVPTLEDLRMVAPALARYTEDTLLGDLWKRPELSQRDRSIIAVAALIARNQTIEMPYHFNLALDNGSSQASSLRSLRISRSTPAGRMPRQRWRSRKMFSASVESDPISFHRPRVSFCPLMRLPKSNARPGLSRMSVLWLRDLCSTPVTYFFMISGYVRR
jgi:carboxymuconolactone decarboxylase family protein